MHPRAVGPVASVKFQSATSSSSVHREAHSAVPRRIAGRLPLERDPDESASDEWTSCCISLLISARGAKGVLASPPFLSCNRTSANFFRNAAGPVFVQGMIRAPASPRHVSRIHWKVPIRLYCEVPCALPLHHSQRSQETAVCKHFSGSFIISPHCHSSIPSGLSRRIACKFGDEGACDSYLLT